MARFVIDWTLLSDSGVKRGSDAKQLVANKIKLLISSLSFSNSYSLPVRGGTTNPSNLTEDWVSTPVRRLVGEQKTIGDQCTVIQGTLVYDGSGRTQQVGSTVALTARVRWSTGSAAHYAGNIVV